jgi:hypothetical protein
LPALSHLQLRPGRLGCCQWVTDATWQDRASIVAGCRDKIHILLIFFLMHRILRSLKSSPDLRLSPHKRDLISSPIGGLASRPPGLVGPAVTFSRSFPCFHVVSVRMLFSDSSAGPTRSLRLSQVQLGAPGVVKNVVQMKNKTFSMISIPFEFLSEKIIGSPEISCTLISLYLYSVLRCQFRLLS